MDDQGVPPILVSFSYHWPGAESTKSRRRSAQSQRHAHQPFAVRTVVVQAWRKEGNTAQGRFVSTGLQLSGLNGGVARAGLTLPKRCYEQVSTFWDYLLTNGNLEGSNDA